MTFVTVIINSPLDEHSIIFYFFDYGFKCVQAYASCPSSLEFSWNPGIVPLDIHLLLTGLLLS